MVWQLKRKSGLEYAKENYFKTSNIKMLYGLTVNPVTDSLLYLSPFLMSWNLTLWKCIVILPARQSQDLQLLSSIFIYSYGRLKNTFVWICSMQGAKYMYIVFLRTFLARQPPSEVSHVECGLHKLMLLAAQRIKI
jgi:hypothetical protein